MISIKFSQKYHPIKQKKLLKETNLTVKEISCVGGFLSDMTYLYLAGVIFSNLTKFMTKFFSLYLKRNNRKQMF